MAVSLGQLDRRIKLRTPLNTDTEFGHKKVTGWKDIDVWAKVDYIGSAGGNEKGIGAIMSENEQIIFTIRYRPVTHRMRVQYQGKEYDIERIEEVDRKRLLKLACRTDG